MIALQENVNVSRRNDIFQVALNGYLTESDRKELDFWKNDPLESPNGNLFDNIVEKSYFMRIFKRLLPELEIQGDERILEIGAGHGWASALIKRAFPSAYVVVSDLSPDAIRFAEKYEHLLDVKIDEKWSFSSRHIPFENESFDRVFTFAAFHHCGVNSDFSQSLTEVTRILKPGGKIFLLYEPSTPRFWRALARKRVNRKRDSVDEDILVVSELVRSCKHLGCKLSRTFYPDYQDRTGMVETFYYFILSKVPLLQHCLPCTVNLTISKAT